VSWTVIGGIILAPFILWCIAGFGALTTALVYLIVAGPKWRR